MTNLTSRIGFPLQLDISTSKILFGNNVTGEYWEKTLAGNSVSGDALWKSMMFASGFTDKQGNITREPDLKQFLENPDSVLYYGYRNIFLNNPSLLDILKQHKIRPDITILPPGCIGKEFLRTEGHEHIERLPEIYEVIHGKAAYLLFKTQKQNQECIEDVMLILAEEGEHVLFPPFYHHISYNVSNVPLIMTDFLSTNAKSDFKYIKKHNGAPYWLANNKGKIKTIKNPQYKKARLRTIKPSAEIPELFLRKNCPMFALVQQKRYKNLFELLNDNSDKFSEIYRKAFVAC
ncbi:MAG: hypothetical protein KKE50_06700 [Nanoarchaeota archaeon]|nr:hypothetical protein [Nanoarchaeota archaeon]